MATDARSMPLDAPGPSADSPASPLKWRVTCTGNAVTIYAGEPFTVTWCLPMNDRESDRRGVNWVDMLRGVPLDVPPGAREDLYERIPPCITVVLAQTPKSSSVSQPGARLSPAVLSMAREEKQAVTWHECTIWGLLFATRYALELKTASGAVSQQTAEVGPIPRDAIVFGGSSLILDPEAAQTLLRRRDFDEWPLAMRNLENLFLFPPDGEIGKVSHLVGGILYRGMFPMPMEIPPRAHGHDTGYALVLLNPEERYILDLRPPPGTASAAGSDSSATSSCRIPWRHSKKVRRAIKSGRYAVAVRESPADVYAALQRCSDYHEDCGRGTWMAEQWCAVYSQLGAASSAAAAGSAAGRAGDSSTSFGVHPMCVDVVDAESGETLAGCVGFSLGSVYHDVSMYTVELSSQGFGNLVTKVVGEALEMCGYDMWYWGIKVAYMADYEGRYGAKALAREDFYQRWVAARDQPTKEHVADYLRGNKGMLPHVPR